ncbi:hypothetical protein MKZ38_001522 [Zalerion maritima]|uniref:Uncharacterized protein n=1 Tax=Zalerion maritima TaxID=339359 RepID=A0AAD5WRF9_9PEZI|nr:hypothetical protein MKZ38_001522 [Zalerion maritima]
MDIDDSKTDPDPRLDEMGDDTKMDEEPKPRYKSWKKKYRKMRMVYDAKVYESEELHKKELKAIETAKRIAIENDRILDMLQDINNSGQIPPEKRIAIDEPTPHDSDGSAQPIRLSKTLQELEANTAHVGYDESAKAGMLSDIEHPSTLPNADTDARPPSFLTADDIDNYLFEIDSRIGGPGSHLPTLAPLAHHGKRAADIACGVVTGTAAPTANGATNGHAAPLHIGPSTAPASSSSSYQLRNPASVYNWLRKHCPQVFLQDGEKETKDKDHKDDHKEKDIHHADKPTAKTKTPNARGARASKRSSKAAAAARASSMDMEMEDDDGGGTPAPAAVATTARGKRKRVMDDDPGYRPKGGSSRPNKKKRKSEGTDTPTAKRPRKTKKELSEEIVRDDDGDVDAMGDDE